jgi:hypothetical protein
MPHVLQEPKVSLTGSQETAQNQVLLVKLMVDQLLTTLPAFYGTRRLIKVFTTACLQDYPETDDLTDLILMLYALPVSSFLS